MLTTRRWSTGAAAEQAPSGATWESSTPAYRVGSSRHRAGPIHTERYQAYLDGQSPEAVARVGEQMGELHPPGGVGRSEEVAAAVAYLALGHGEFVNGAVLPVDGGPAAMGLDPEAAG